MQGDADSLKQSKAACVKSSRARLYLLDQFLSPCLIEITSVSGPQFGSKFIRVFWHYGQSELMSCDWLADPALLFVRLNRQ